MDKVFSPIRINSLELPNRLIMSPLHTGYASQKGEVTERLIRYCEERARGGVGLIIVETSCVEWAGRNGRNGLAIADDNLVRGLAALVRRVHAQGCKIAIQLLHRGRAALPQVTGQSVKLVSWAPPFTPAAESVVLEEDEIPELVQAYGRAAGRVLDAGFDALEIHGAHGYIINQFLSPLTNLRDDAYGGNPEKRLRFPREVIAEVRRVVGTDFPVLMRIGSQEGVEGGLTVDDMKPVARALVDAGVNALHVSAGIQEADMDIPLAHFPKAWNVKNASTLREAVGRRVPVIAVGRIGDAALIRNIIEEDQIDMIALGRPLLADPHLPEKMRRGADGEILPCVACNEACVGHTRKAIPVQCAFNPRTGSEGLYPSPAPQRGKKRNICVVGGGPAGMQTALHAAELGHNVTLFEASAKLGGLLHAAAKPPHKEELAGVIGYFAQALQRHPLVNLRLNTPATVEELQSLRPQAIFAATGSEPVMPAMCGPDAVAAEDILLSRTAAKPGHRVLVLGGGLVGCETAEWLASAGHEVTVIEMQPVAAADMQASNKRWLMERLNRLRVDLRLSTKLVERYEGGALVAGPWGEETLPCDTLVVAVGYRPRRNICAAMHTAGLPFRMVGDCSRVGRLMDAIHGGFLAVEELDKV